MVQGELFYNHMTKDDLIEKIVDMNQQITLLKQSEEKLKFTESKLRDEAYDLGERIKELNSLYSISFLVENRGNSLDDILQGTVDIIPSGMRYPDVCCVRLVVDGKEYRTRHFKETEWQIRKKIKVASREAGYMTIFYMEEMPLVNGSPFLDEERYLVDAIGGRLGNIIERKRSQDLLHEREAQYSAVVENARDGIVVIQDYVYKFANRAMVEITGYSKDELTGMDFGELFVPNDRAIIKERYDQRISGVNVQSVYEAKMLSRNGKGLKDVEISFSLITYDAKSADLAFIRDISERKKQEERIRQLAYHDSLTGLPNRVLFNEQFALIKAQAERSKRKIAIMLLDLDHFKEVNDTLGHTVGDQLLKEVGHRLTSVLRKEDIVARMGGDEFIVLLQEVSWHRDIENTAAKIVEAFRIPFVFDGHKILTTTSAGIAVYPGDGEDVETLLKNADIAMYRSKTEGRDQYRFYY